MSRPLLVIVASAPTTAELRRRRDAAALAGADLVELRLDSVADPDVAAALAGRTTPVIVTCRPEWEGGAFKDSEDERRRILECALQQGAEYVDVEFKAGFRSELIASTGGKRIVSVDPRFRGRAGRSHGACARDARSAARRSSRWRSMAHSLSDNLRLLQLERAANTVLIGMGPSGAPTRVLAAHFQFAAGHMPATATRRPDFGGADAGRIQVSRDHRPDRHLRRRRVRRSRIRFRRRCTTPRFARPVSTLCTCRWWHRAPTTSRCLRQRSACRASASRFPTRWICSSARTTWTI